MTDSISAYQVIDPITAEKWAAQARAEVRLEKDYPFYLVDQLSNCIDGTPWAGVVTEPLLHGDPCEIQLISEWPNEGSFKRTYLHEVAHVISIENYIHVDPSGIGHNQYFAVLVAMMYRRAKEIEYFRVYDFHSSRGFEEDGKRRTLSNHELSARFNYIIKRSDQLARSSLTIEAAAAWVKHNDYLPSLLPKPTKTKPQRPWWAFWG